MIPAFHISQYELARVLLVDGDPLSDISATERISLVVYKGERIRRASLFNQK